MINWKKLANIPANENIRCGSIFRFPAKWPYENFVDFMVFDNHKSDMGMGIVVVSGNKSGLIAVHLPKESSGEFNSTISSSWLKENWNYWVYTDCMVDDVYVLDYHPVPEELPTL